MFLIYMLVKENNAEKNVIVYNVTLGCPVPLLLYVGYHYCFMLPSYSVLMLRLLLNYL